MSGQELLAQRKTTLASVIRDAFGTNHHSDGFALRLLGSDLSGVMPDSTGFKLDDAPTRLIYGGYPDIAYFGFGIGAGDGASSSDIDKFLSGLRRLRDRQSNALDTLAADDIALLGIADGVAQLKSRQMEVADVIKWLSSIIDRTPSTKTWSFRARLLSGELVEPYGRLEMSPNTANPDEMALEIALRNVWSTCFRSHTDFGINTQNTLLKTILTSIPPQEGDLDRAVVWLKALEVLVDNACQALMPSVSDTVRLLRSVQGALKRWVWKEQPRRKNSQACQWLMDEESDVQALLWTVLFPIYGAEIVDERYLRDCGLVQARADLGILKLKLIIEVKMARELKDFSEFEGQIGEDLGLYFWDTGQFDRMIVFVYDDCDHPQPEKYDVFRNALLRRGSGRIEDVIILRRPSMIPDRNQRSRDFAPETKCNRPRASHQKS